MTPPFKNLIISGLGRCGTSLVMQMLDAAGHPVFGRYPAYEEDETSPENISCDFLEQHKGKAIKVIDPHRAEPGIFKKCRVIFMSRNIEQQALSQIKFASFFMGIEETPSRKVKMKMMAALDRDHARATRQLALADDYMFADFEEVLEDPEYFLKRVSIFSWNQNLDIKKGAEKVIPRSPRCYPGLLEIALLGIQNRGKS